VAEQSRSRNLVERLSEEDFAPRNAPMERFTGFLRLRRELEAAKLALEIERSRPRDNSPKPLSHDDEPRERLSSPENVKRHFDDLRRMLRSPQSLGGAAVSADEEAPLELSGEAAAVIAEAETHLAALAKELRQADAEWDPDRPVKPLTGAEIQALIPTDAPTAFVQFTLFAETGVALIITCRSVECVRLPSLSYRTISEAALEWFTTYYDRAENPCDWEDKMDMRLASVGTALLPLWLALEESSIHRIILSPNRWLHIFPLHACMLVDGRRRAADAFEISYTPSFSVLGRCVRRTRGVTGPALAIGNPTGDLHFTEAEIAAARCHYPKVHVLDQSSATKAAIFADAPECWLFLYTGHATFDIENPVLSSLVLETKDQTQRAKWLSLGDAFCHLNLGKCALAILNGCESGLLLPDRTDEYLALSSGFLHAGAVCVLSSQWAVHDLSAALLMDRFHAEWRGGKSAAGALREAARWLREDIRNGTDLITRVLPEFLREIPEGSALHDACLARADEYAIRAGASPPFASPAHWAAFSAVGKAW
jgi:CHAT domain-containing protein